MTCSINDTLLQWDVKSGIILGKPMKRELDDLVCIAIIDKCGMILAIYVLYWDVKNEVIWWHKSTGEMIREPVVLESGSHLS